jgi:hypothetical protein
MPKHPPNRFLSFCSIASIYCLMTEPEDLDKYFLYTERALFSLKLFADFSFDEVRNALGHAAQDMIEITSGEEALADRFDGVLASHLRYLKESGLCQSVSLFLTSYEGYFGKITKPQIGFLFQVFDACDMGLKEYQSSRQAFESYHDDGRD